jgi:hypothetical protein
MKQTEHSSIFFCLSVCYDILDHQARLTTFVASGHRVTEAPAAVTARILELRTLAARCLSLAYPNEPTDIETY